MQIDHIEGFLGDLWGAPHLGDWAKKYYRAIDAYNTSYSGIKADDFLDCWIQFDILGLAKVLDKHHTPRPYSFNENPEKKASEGHSELVKELVREFAVFYMEDPDGMSKIQ